MPPMVEQGVPFSMPALPTLEQRMPDWQAVWVFLQLDRSGSFRACAKRHSMTINSIRRSVDRLEHDVGFRVLTRHVDGIRVTPEGERVLKAAQDMERAAIGLLRTREALSDLEGSVRIAVTEGLGAVWLAPRAAEFQRLHPLLRVDLVCAMTSADILRMEADLAIQLTRPEAPDLKVVRLGYMHVVPYASRAYAERYGLPTTIEELARHRLAILAADQTSSAEILTRTFGAVPFTGTVAITTNTSTSHCLAIANGVGIGLLPTYVTPLQTGLLPVDCGAYARLDIWMTYHPDAEGIPRVRSAIRWMRTCFDAKLFPFFAENFVQPKLLPPISKIVSLRNWVFDEEKLE